jgi:hypothetical protein
MLYYNSHDEYSFEANHSTPPPSNAAAGEIQYILSFAAQPIQNIDTGMTTLPIIEK